MAVTIFDFQDVLSSAQIKKGQDYFERGAVQEFIETKDDEWQAEVQGSENYYVKILLDGDMISETSCDCPHDNPFCKHVVAVLFEIRSQKNIIIESGQTSETKKKKVSTRGASFETVLKNLSENDLKGFVSEFASRNKEFRSLFLLRFDAVNRKDGLQKFRTLIRKTAATYNYRGFIEWRDSTKAMQGAITVLNEAEAAFKKQNFRITFDACCAVIMEVPSLVQHMDDSNGIPGDCIYRSFDFLGNMAESADAPHALKDEIFSFARKEISNSIYNDLGFDDHLLQLMCDAAYEKEKLDQVFDFIDKKLITAYQDFEKKSLLDAKINLLKKNGRDTEADEVIFQNKNQWEFREQLIRRSIAEKDFDKAKGFAEEGIKEESAKQTWHKHPERWQEWLLQIAVLEKDVTAIRNLSKLRYFKTFDHKYYKLYKQSFPAEEWSEECAIWIKWFLNKGRISFEEMYALANIYITEGMNERLFVLLQKNPGYDFAKYCQPYLQNEFLSELLTIYNQALKQYAIMWVGRNYYVEMRKRLKELQKLEGGKNVVRDLISYFLRQYKNRPAMIEELKKLIV